MSETSMVKVDSSALQPRSMDDVARLAVSASKSGLFGIKSEHDAIVRLMTGLELGIPAMTSLRCIRVFNGSPCLDAVLIVALAQRHPDCVRWAVVETTAERCTIETAHRKHGKQSLTWTMDQARRAGLAGKDNWKHYPEAMLRARCGTALARLVYPDAFAGLYAPDELGDQRGPIVETTVVETTVVDAAATAETPVAAPTATAAAPSSPGAAPVCPYGRCKGQLLSAMTDADLVVLGQAVQRAIGDPARAKSKAANKRLLGQIAAELDSRGGEPEPAGPPPHDAETGEVQDQVAEGAWEEGRQ